MGERMVTVGDLELWTESFGDPSEETILLVNGPATGLAFPDELCSELAAGGRHVIRYDHRDTGASTAVDFTQHPYTLSDLAGDAIGVLDAYAVQAVHLVGFSMGGMIAQVATLEHPDRVSSLTSWGSTPLGASFFIPDGASPLPGPEEKVLIALAGAATDDPTELIVATLRSYSGALEPFDEERTRGLARRWMAHTRDPKAFMNHWLAGGAAPDRAEMLGAVSVPTLVIHGSVDPVVPPPHGEATVNAIPGARLLEIDGMGHDFPSVALPRIVRAILRHTDRSRGDGVKFGVVLPRTDLPRLLDLVRFAEDAGVDSVWVQDGFTEGHLEAMTVMAAVAATTRQVEIGAYMVNASLRDAKVLTRTVSTLDRLAPGRIRIVLGTGWDRNDYEALGQPFPSPDVRMHDTRETLALLKAGTNASVEIAGVRDDHLSLAALQGDGWAVSADALDTFFERVTALKRACEETGRSFADLRLSCTLPIVEGVTDRILDLADHEMDEILVALNGEGDENEVKRLVDAVRSS